MDRVECIVIGAGVVGLAIARELAMAGRDVVVLEAHEAIGMETSSRNSEVIHAGIYYPKDSLMARFCVEGRQMLYSYAQERGVPHRRCGKLIVATDTAEVQKLAAIRDRAAANGVGDMRVLSREEALELEPALACTGALLSPSTGIVDSHSYMLALQGDAEAHGAMFAFNAPFLSSTREGALHVVEVGGEAPMRLGCSVLVNAAGLHAPAVARRIAGLDPASLPRTYYARGTYFTWAGRSPFSRLIYPVPVPGGLGVHLTVDMGGQIKFGPDIEWIESLDYEVDPRRADSFYTAIRRYWPALDDGSLAPGYAGIRPKIVPPEIAVQDFRIDGPQQNGVAGLVNLFGIESPGLTSSLAIAGHVGRLLGA